MNQLKILVPFLFLMIFSTLPAQTVTNIPKIRVSASGGLGYLFAEGSNQVEGVISQEKVDQLSNQLRWASHLNGDIHYLFPFGFGVGAKYIFHRTAAQAEDVIFYSPVSSILPMPHNWVRDMSEKDYTNYAGLSFGGLSPIGNNNNIYLTSSLSVGYAWIHSEVSMSDNHVLVTGGNVAMNAEMGVDYLFTNNLGIGVNLGTFVGYFNKVKISDGTTTQSQKLGKEERYNASNIHMSVGLRYYLNR